MAIGYSGNQAMGYYDPREDMYHREKMRAMEQMQNDAMNQQMRAFGGMLGQQGLQNAIQPVSNPEPNKVLLLLE